MKEKMIFIKIGLILCLLVFISSMLITKSDSKKSVGDVEKSITEAVDLSNMEKGGDRDVRRAFGINVNDYDGVAYYKPVSTMDVEEILIVKLKSNDQADALESAVQSRVDSQLQSFQGYGAEQCQLLENAVIKVQGNFVLYAVSKDTSACKETFLSSL